MNRQEQLDAVVRNYGGTWPEPIRFATLPFMASWRNGEVMFSQLLIGEYTFTREEVEARKAELQNMTQQAQDVLIRIGHDIEPICTPDDFEYIEWYGEEFPPVGVECEISNCGNSYEWCKIKYMGDSLCVVDHKHVTDQHYHLNSVKFRQIESDRDKWREKFLSVWNATVTNDRSLENLANVIYDAIVSGHLHVPTNQPVK